MSSDTPPARILKGIDGDEERWGKAAPSRISIFTAMPKWETDKRITQTDLRNCNVNILSLFASRDSTQGEFSLFMLMDLFSDPYCSRGQNAINSGRKVRRGLIFARVLFVTYVCLHEGIQFRSVL